MTRWLIRVLLAAAAIGAQVPAANAQYMFLDSNGNGVPDLGDRLNPTGSPTTVDVYLRTKQNRDGSAATCDIDGTPLGCNWYVVNLHAVGGLVSYSGFINRLTSFTVSFGELNPDGVNYKNGFGQQAALAPGQYRLCTLTITSVAGTPRIDIVDEAMGSTDLTEFGSPSCPGNDFDSAYKLAGPTGIGSDWTDVDGLGAPGGQNQATGVTDPGNKVTD